MKSSVYVETTVPSYLVSRLSRDLVVAAHQELTREWWDNRRQNFSVFISQFVLDEAGLGDAELARRRLALVDEIPELEITEAVAGLAQKLVEACSIPAKAATDAAHIAIAAVHSMDYLLTWNCAHIANAEISRRVHAVCAAEGFVCPVICTPEELMGVEEHES